MINSSHIFRVFSLLAAAITAFGQPASYSYALKTLAGSNPLGDGGLATQALLLSPSAVALDGKISTIVQLPVYGNDMKLGADGFFYITAFATVFKASPAGVVPILAGTGTPGTSGDGTQPPVRRSVQPAGLRLHTVAGVANAYL